MTEHAAAPKPLSELPAFDPQTGNLNVVIETPKGSRNKYTYDPGWAAFRLRGVLPEGSSFPYDFGFIPSTLGEDGDPLDVLVLLDAPVPVGCLVEARPLGVIEAEQTEAGATARNDRLLAAAVHAHTHEEVRSLADLRPRSWSTRSSSSSSITTGRRARSSGRSTGVAPTVRPPWWIGAYERGGSRRAEGELSLRLASLVASRWSMSRLYIEKYVIVRTIPV